MVEIGRSRTVVITVTIRIPSSVYLTESPAPKSESRAVAPTNVWHVSFRQHHRYLSSHERWSVTHQREQIRRTHVPETLERVQPHPLEFTPELLVNPASPRVRSFWHTDVHEEVRQQCNTSNPGLHQPPRAVPVDRGG